MTREQAMAKLLSPWALYMGFSIDEAQLMDLSVRDPLTDCWEWIGTVKENGYGRLSVNGKRLHAHRVALAVFRGIVAPPELDVCHTCDFRRCINPAHLFVGTRLDNMQDAKRKGRLSVGAAHGALVSAGCKRRRNHGVG